jgi:UDP-glucuronate decarboxylase
MRLEDGRVVSNLVAQALRGQPLTIYGSGAQTRSFCYVDDLVEGLIRLMATPATCTGPINLGNPAEFTILELAEQVRALTGSRAPIVFRPLPADDPRQRRPDIITGASRELGWRPRVPLNEGLRRTIDHFDDLLRGLRRSEVVRLVPQRERAMAETSIPQLRLAAGFAEDEEPFLPADAGTTEAEP